jgi:hypothetical protein
MATPLHAVTSTLNVLPHGDVLSSVAWDSIITFGLAGVIITAAVAILALLPWTDQQIASADQEGRAVYQHARTWLAAHTTPVAVAVPHSS